MSFSNAVSSELGIFGLPFAEDRCRIVYLPVPWEVTTSYGIGASDGPALIRKASEQVDLFDLETTKAFEQGYFMREIPAHILKMSRDNKTLAQKAMQLLLEQSADVAEIQRLQNAVNAACENMVDWVYHQSQEILSRGQILGLIGGDHSTPFGALRAISEKWHGDFGILHFDAHADLRVAYQGFQHSHASIMHNVMTAPWAPKKLVQVGIRDFCEEEFHFIQNSEGKIKTFFDLENKNRALSGEPWSVLADEIVKELPRKVYVSFDIDGLSPDLCPHTGTPVPGGLSLNEVFYILKDLVASGRSIIGFDVNEVSSGGQPERATWDGNVGARILYKLSGWAIQSQVVAKS